MYDCSGARVDSGKIIRPNDRSVFRLDRQLPQGSYTVTWRVISADAHPVAGAFVFSVKAADPSGSCKQVFGKGTPGEVDALFKFARALDFALILLVVGGATALAVVLRSAAMDLRARLYRILAGLAVGLVFAGILCIVLQGAVAGGFGLSEAFRWNTVDSVLQTQFGKAFLLQLGLRSSFAPGRFTRGGRAAGTRALVGGAPAADPLGGRPRPDERRSRDRCRHGPRGCSLGVGGRARVHDSRLAARRNGSLASRLACRASLLDARRDLGHHAPRRRHRAGLPGARSRRHGTSSWPSGTATYRRDTATCCSRRSCSSCRCSCSGAYNNRYAVPKLKRQIASVVEQRRFLRAAGAELAIMAVIVGVTAVLVSEPPAKASVNAAKYATDTVPIGPLELNYIVEPAKTGQNTIHLYFFQQGAGFPGQRRRRRSCRRRFRARTSARCASRSTKIVPSHYTTSAAVFPQPGDWQVTIEARRGQFEALTQTVTVPIREG